jgi:hypothetical protein
MLCTQYFYNHANRLRLENYYTWSFLGAPAGVLNRFWIQVAVSLLKRPHGVFIIETAVTLTFQKRNGYESITVISVGKIQVGPLGDLEYRLNRIFSILVA